MGKAHRRYNSFVNARLRVSGHLFQARFGSVTMDDGSAVFLILELSRPYSGVIRLSSAPLDRLMLQLGDPAKPAE